MTFATWYHSEKTLSIQAIVTTRRGSFYWLTILFTFALGTAAGDLAAESLGLGFLTSVLVFGALIAPRRSGLSTARRGTRSGGPSPWTTTSCSCGCRNRSPAATSFVRNYLLHHRADGNTIQGRATTVPSSGFTCAEPEPLLRASFTYRRPRLCHADVVGIVRHGVVYTGGTEKIAEYGGVGRQDRNVPIVIAGAGSPTTGSSAIEWRHSDRSHDPSRLWGSTRAPCRLSASSTNALPALRARG